MLPTFSLNKTPYALMGKVAKLIRSANATNMNWLTDAYISIVEEREVEGLELGLSNYSAVCEKNAALKRADKRAQILTQEEIAQGFKGVSSDFKGMQTQDQENIEQMILMDGVVEEFLTARETIYYTEGKDIWRLLELSKSNDRKAVSKLVDVVNTTKTYIEEIAELIKIVVEQEVIYKELEEILA